VARGELGGTKVRGTEIYLQSLWVFTVDDAREKQVDLRLEFVKPLA
jgi:hypothetical protein